jgi:hypothetical protein
MVRLWNDGDDNNNDDDHPDGGGMMMSEEAKQNTCGSVSTATHTNIKRWRRGVSYKYSQNT